MADNYQKIIDATYDHAVDLELLSNTQVRVLNVQMRMLATELKKQLRSIDPGGVKNITAKQKRLEKYLTKANKLIDATYNKMTAGQNRYLKNVARMEDAATRNIVNDSLGDQVLINGLSNEQLTLISDKTISEGLTSQTWFSKKLPNDLKTVLVQQLQTGMSANETIQQLTSRINKKTDISRNHVETLVRTTTNGIANKVRDDIYLANDDVIEGEEHISTLDLLTSDICRERDGLSWTIPEHKPIGGHGLRWRPFPLHPNERSTWAPVFRNIDDITGIDTSKWSEGTRATMDGPNTATENYSQWFAKQGTERQLEVLGPGKLSLYRKNKLSMRDLTRPDGSALTIDQLTTKVNKKGFNPKPETTEIPDKEVA